MSKSFRDECEKEEFKEILAENRNPEEQHEADPIYRNIECWDDDAPDSNGLYWDEC